MLDRLYAVAISGLVAGPFAICKSSHDNGFTLVHLPSQAKIIDLELQNRAGAGSTRMLVECWRDIRVESPGTTCEV